MFPARILFTASACVLAGSQIVFAETPRLAGGADAASVVRWTPNSSPYDDGYARGGQDCRNGRTPAKYLPVPAQPASADAMQFYRGWWDGCDWAWNIPQDWPLKRIGPAPRADTDQPTVDVAEYDEGYDLGRRACTQWGWAETSLRTNEERADFVRGYNRGCEIYRAMFTSQHEQSGVSTLDADHYLDLYGSCYAERAASDNSTPGGRTRDAMEQGCKDALDDLAAGVKSALDTAARPAQAKRLPPDAGVLARRAADDEKFYDEGFSTGQRDCAAGSTQNLPNMASLWLSYGNGWDLGCDRALAAYARANPSRRVVARQRDAGNYAVGSLQGEIDCRYGRVLPGMPDRTTFGSDFVRGWNDACDRVMMLRFGAIVGQARADGERDHSTPQYQQLAAAAGDYTTLLPAAGSIQPLLAHGTTVARPPVGASMRPMAHKPVQAASASAAIHFDPTDPQRRPHLEKRDVARGTIDDWKSRGLLDVHDARRIAADSSRSIDVAHGKTIAADSSRGLDQRNARQITTDSSSSIRQHRTGEITADSSQSIDQHRGRDAAQHKSSEIEERQAAAVQQHQSTDVQQHDAAGLQQHQGTQVKQHAASEAQQHQAADVQQHQGAEVRQQDGAGVQQHDAKEVRQTRAGSVEQHKSSEIRQREGSEVREHQATTVEQQRAAEIEQHQASGIQQHQAGEVQQRAGAEIQQHQAAGIRQHAAAGIEQHRAAEVQQHTATEIQQNKAAEVQQHRAVEIQQDKAAEIQQHKGAEIEQHQAAAIQQHQAAEIAQHQAGEIQQHQATAIQQHQAAEIQKHQAAEIQQHEATEIQQHQAAEIKQHQAAEIQQHQATEIQQHKAAEIEQHTATEIQRHQATEIQPYRGKEIQVYHSGDARRAGALAPPPDGAAVSYDGIANVQGSAYRGAMRLVLQSPLADGPVAAHVVFSRGLSGSGALTGSAQAGTILLSGTVSAGADQYTITMNGQTGDGGSIAGTYLLSKAGTVVQTTRYTIRPTQP